MAPFAPRSVPFRKLIQLLVFLLLASPLVWLESVPCSQAIAQGKKVGFTGDPAKKRGVEYGFDKGYQAGKADKDAGLDPDPKRHDDFNDPNKFYRYEFGSRSNFVGGFKGGFVGGYQKAYGKKVKVSSPSSYSGASASSSSTEAPKPEKPAKTYQAPSRQPVNPASDAL